MDCLLEGAFRFTGVVIIPKIDKMFLKLMLTVVRYMILDVDLYVLILFWSPLHVLEVVEVIVPVVLLGHTRKNASSRGYLFKVNILSTPASWSYYYDFCAVLCFCFCFLLTFVSVLVIVFVVVVVVVVVAVVAVAVAATAASPVTVNIY